MWICPDVPSFEIQNDPLVFQQGNGRTFNLVVNNCKDAQRINHEQGISTYNDNFNCYDNEDDIVGYQESFSVYSKIMTQKSTNPIEYHKGNVTETYFTNRITTDILAKNGQ